MDSNTYDSNTSTNTHDTHNPLAGDGVTNTHNPLTGDKSGPNPPPGTNPVTGRTNDGNLGRHEQQPVAQTDTTGTHTGARTGTHTGAGTGVTSGTNDHNTHNPLTGDGATNTHNPLTGDKTGPHPPSETNPITGRTDDDQFGRNEQQAPGPHRDNVTGTGAGTTSGTNAHNTHNPLTGDGVNNTHNPMTGDKTGPHPPPGTNPATGRTGDGNLGRHEQQLTGYTDTGRTTDTRSGTGVSTHGGAGTDLTSGTNAHNTHNPLTGDGVTNTHNPMTGDKTGPHPPTGTNPVTGRTDDGNLGRHEQQPGGYANTTGARAGTHTTGTQTGTHNAGAGVTSGNKDHNTHNPLTGGGATNTHNPLTGDKTSPHPPLGTNPVTGRTNDGNLGRNEQQSAGYTGTTGAPVTGPGDHTIHDTARGAHTTGAGGTGPQHTSTKTSGSGAKAVLGRVEATFGAMINNSEMHAKGVQKQDEAQAAKLAKQQEAAHGGADVRH